MIATPKPGSDRFRLLALIVAYPGELGTAELAAHLWPPAKIAPKSLHDTRCVHCAWPPPKSPTGKPWPAEPPASMSRAPCMKCAAKEAEKAAQAKVSAMLRQLGTKGLICACGPPVLSGWFSGRMRSRGVAEALRRSHPAWPGKVPPLEQHISMVWRVTEQPPTVADLLGKRPNGAAKQVYRDLCAWGVVVPPSYRWATEAGRELIAKGGSQNTPLRLSSRLRYAAAENPDVVNDSEVKGA